MPGAIRKVTAAFSERDARIVFENYRLRIAGVISDYGMHDREEAPRDSRQEHG